MAACGIISVRGSALGRTNLPKFDIFKCKTPTPHAF